MSKDYESKGSLRAAFALRELDKSQRALSGGLPGLIIRVALATVFMYLLVIAYQLLGTPGTLLVSALFLFSLCIPALSRMATRYFTRRRSEDHSDGGRVASKAREEAWPGQTGNH
jgi:hypothetical protein